jgi:hypothetical protein
MLASTSWVIIRWHIARNSIAVSRKKLSQYLLVETEENHENIFGNYDHPDDTRTHDLPNTQQDCEFA